MEWGCREENKLISLNRAVCQKLILCEEQWYDENCYSEICICWVNIFRKG